MSGVNLNALSDEQLDELIVGCRTLRAQRERFLDTKQPSTPPSRKGTPQLSKKHSTQKLNQ